MNPNFVLQADPNFTYSMNTQIKEQLKWLIGAGFIRPGELLPPAGRLADKLNVNRNTVTLVYTQLRDEGIVSIKKGRGTQVLDGPATGKLTNVRRPMYDLLMRTMDEARENGLDPNELAAASFAFVQLFGRNAAKKKNVLFIECRGHDYPFYRTQIERETKAEVTTLFLEDFAEDPRKLDESADQADLVITTLNHADEVKQLLSGKGVRLLTIGAAADVSVMLEIAGMEAGSKVAFVCLGKQGGRWMAERVMDAGIRHIDSIVMGMDNKESLQETIRQSKRVFASMAVYNELKAIASDKVVLFPMILEKSSEKLLKDAAE